MPQPRPAAVWFTAERPRRPRLSRARIARAAVAVLDADGVDGLTMRRLAARLDAGTMSLYEYVGGREDVLDLAVDEAVSEIEPSEIELDDSRAWRAALARQLAGSRSVMQRHPWLPALMATRPLLGPHALARAETVYALLVRAGLDGPGLTAAVGTLTYYVQGFAAMEHHWHGRVRDTAAEADLRGQAQRYLDGLAASYPTLARHADVTDDDFDAAFELGLAIILDGIEAQLET